MKKLAIIFSMCTLILSGCGKPPGNPDDTNNTQKEKQELFITTQKVADFSREITITKTGIVRGSSSIQINAQASGQVGEIYIKEGDTVSSGQPLVRINDTIASYNLSTQSSINNLQSSKLNRQKTKISLDKAVSDAQIALDKAKLDLENTRESVKTQITTSERNAQNANAQDNITKAKLDFDNFLKNTQETLDGFERTYSSERTKLLNFLTNTIDTTDKLLGVSPIYGADNDQFEDFLGARNRSNKKLAESELRSLMYEYDTFKNTTPIGTLELRVSELERMYDTTTKLLDYTEQTLIDTIESNFLTSSEISTYRTTIDSLQTTLQANKAGLIVFLNGATSFLATYEQNITTQETTLALQIQNINTNEQNALDSLGQTKNSVAQQIRAAENLVINSQNALENAKQNRDVTLSQLTNQIQSAQIQVQKSQAQSGKLVIYSPIDGVIGNILVDVGQEVAPGVPSIGIESPQSVFEIGVDSTIVSTLQVGQSIQITYKNSTQNGTITSISPRANSGLQHTVTITFESDETLLGDFAEALIPVMSPHIILPLEHLNIISQSQGSVWIYGVEGVQKKNVVIGNIWSDKVEIVSGLDEADILITSNMSNYNPDTFTITTQ